MLEKKKKKESSDSGTGSSKNSIWTKTTQLFVQLLFCIPMKLFNCYDIEPFESQHVKMPLHKNDSSVISSAHWNHRNLIVSGNYLSLVQIYAIFFFSFWIKGTHKPKTITFKICSESFSVFFLSSGNRVIILMSAWNEPVAYFKISKKTSYRAVFFSRPIIFPWKLSSLIQE